MEITKEYLDIAHANNLQWKKAMEFYKEEIAYMRKMLEEVNKKNTSKEFKIIVSHFENQFTINGEVVDELDHEINLREDYITRRIKENVVGYDHRVIKQYAELKGKLSVFEKLFAELKKSFYNFLSPNM